MTGHTYIKQIKLIEIHMTHMLFIKTDYRPTENKYVNNCIFFKKTECRIQAALTQNMCKCELRLTGVVEI